MRANKERTVLAIDPGSRKCGLAVVKRHLHGRLQTIWQAIANLEELPYKIKDALDIATINVFVVGGGTSSKQIIEKVREHFPNISLLIVDEKSTTQQAREKYWEKNKRKGWRLFLPASLQLPPVPIDDYAAIILAERVLSVEHA